MDPITLTASVISLVAQSTRFTSLFFSRNPQTNAFLDDILGDLPVYNDILLEMSETIPSFYGTLSPAANTALNLCERRIQKIFSLMSKDDQGVWKWQGGKDKVRLSDLERAADKYRESVSLLRDVVMDSITHQLLRDQQTNLGRQRAGVRTGETPIAGRPQSEEDPTQFDATIIGHVGQVGQVPGRGLLDSGCDDNWVALEFVQRAALESQIRRDIQIRNYAGFGGHHVRPVGEISLTWFANNARKTRYTKFLVVKDGPFDLLLGKHFLFKESIFKFDASALVLHWPKISKEENEQIEENERRQDEQDQRDRQEALMRAQKEEEARRQAEVSKAAVPKPDDNSSTTTLAPSSAASSIRSGRSPARGPARGSARHFA